MSGPVQQPAASVNTGAMATSSSWSLRAALEPHIDVPFNGWLVLILTLTYACALRAPGLLLLAVLGVSAAIAVFDTTSTAGEMVKTMCELPLGLGSVLCFLVAGRPLKARLLPAFETYVNLAVYGNIGMMVATPAGGTLRGACSRVACAALFLWIVQQGRRAAWRTMRLHDSMFVFTAVGRGWILAHAAYRFVLLTLPCFGSGRRHRLLEVYSLAGTWALSRASGLPFEHCFGMADTLVVPAVTAWSSVATTFGLVPPPPPPRDAHQHNSARRASDHIGATADACLGAVSLAVAAFACYNMVVAPRPRPQGAPRT
ncbi:hypothetical protein JDV02_005285 [Purpureocillium takamizusanense]|uniref:Uncharacterized protein n=1 Tax=Purpureocillium takamizusanense TaxID=2060973 RepID=A0A9Q8VAU8_9HYPO|nr:uncharacterized protein JDV02_005285 [Purpureocillium takamizusanense]UNI19068.1 hypothetical protein JDV02_005285 [Purpureocillium takamizusanense]